MKSNLNLALLKAIEESGLKKSAIAARSNISPKRLWEIYKGLRTPHQAELRKLASTLKVGVEVISPTQRTI